MIGKKWMLALSCAALLAAPAAGFAFGHTTVVADPRLGGSVPYIDGLRETYLQNNVNGILRSRAEALQKKAGEGARLSYEITLNRPSLVSFVLKAEGQRTVYDGVTIDTEAGSVLDEKDLLYTKSADYDRLLDGKHYVFGETGILAESTDGGPFTNLIPYADLTGAINVGGGARLLTSYKLTKEAAGKTLSVKPGELVALYLDANPSLGLEWTLTGADLGRGVVDMGHSFYLPMENPTGRGGSPGQTILFLTFSQPGNYEVTALYGKKTAKTPFNELVYHFAVK